MRVAMYYNNKDVRLEEMPKPKIGAGEILVKAIASGVCGSDVMEWYRIKKAPRVLGHEMTGEIVEVGAGVQNYRVGEHVFVSHHVPCNACRYCLSGNHTVCDTLHTTNFDPGGFAEYIRVPSINVDRGTFRLPDEMTFEEGVFIEPLACVVRAFRLARFQPGQSVIVLGSGIAGLLHIALARALGAGRIIATDISDYRLNAAQRFGADNVIHAKDDVPNRLRECNDNRLADLVIICTGAMPAMNQALQSVDRARNDCLLCADRTRRFAPDSDQRFLAQRDYADAIIWRRAARHRPSNRIDSHASIAGARDDYASASACRHRRRVSPGRQRRRID